ncbi:MAG: hypothetical protein U5O39_12050 [Gammaproteobacteria bacterium]|nr:hypothetical protein [Gammaproteobacteria bacterium]
MKENSLTAVDDDWITFAETNAAPALTRQAIFGRSIFDFIADSESRQLYSAIFDKVRHTGEESVIPFRCDSPDTRRFMELCVKREPGDHVTLESVMIREEHRPVAELLNTDRPASDELVLMCSWCKRIDVDGTWMEIEDAMRELDLFSQEVLPQLSHGICDDCQDNLDREASALGE